MEDQNIEDIRRRWRLYAGTWRPGMEEMKTLLAENQRRRAREKATEDAAPNRTKSTEKSEEIGKSLDCLL